MSYVEDYLASLPGGLDAYPECKQKAAFYRAHVETSGPPNLADDLPEAVRHLITEPEPVSAWIPEVHANVINLAIIDGVLGDSEGFLAHSERVNRRLLGGPLYRVLMKVASPSRVVRGAGARWSKFHQGSHLQVTRHEGTEAELELTWPTQLIPRVLAEGYGRSFLVALDLAGGTDVEVSMRTFSDTRATYRAHWT